MQGSKGRGRDAEQKAQGAAWEWVVSSLSRWKALATSSVLSSITCTHIAFPLTLFSRCFSTWQYLFASAWATMLMPNGTWSCNWATQTFLSLQRKSIACTVLLMEWLEREKCLTERLTKRMQSRAEVAFLATIRWNEKQVGETVFGSRGRETLKITIRHQQPAESLQSNSTERR